MLRLIKGTKKAPRFSQEQLASKYYAMGMDGFTVYQQTKDRWQLRKGVYNLLRYTVYRYHALDTSYGAEMAYKAFFSMQRIVKEFLSALTPRELLQTFPVTKTYEGERWECADYFSTMEKFKNLDMDKPFHCQIEDMTDWLWGYQNKWLMLYLTNLFSVVSKLRQFDGGDNLLTGFFKEQGKKPPETIRVYKDAKGKSYAVDSNGKSMPLHKAKPKWLRVVK
jgi:hypothetical protein